MGEIIILLLAILAIPAFVMFLGWIAGHGRTREDRNKFMLLAIAVGILGIIIFISAGYPGNRTPLTNSQLYLI